MDWKCIFMIKLDDILVVVKPQDGAPRFINPVPVVIITINPILSLLINQVSTLWGTTL
jgi:hypothetical protein